jgi:WD40 repeat protein
MAVSRSSPAQSLRKPVILKGHAEEITALAFSPDSKMLATASSDSTVKLWAIAASGESLTLKAGAPLAFSPNGKLLATAWETRTERAVKLWDAATGKDLATLKHGDYPDTVEFVRELAFSPDGTSLATGEHLGGRVKLWDMATHQELGTINEHEVGLFSNYGLTSLVFSPDGKSLVTAGSFEQLAFSTTRGELAFWDVATLKKRNKVEGHFAGIGAARPSTAVKVPAQWVVFSPAGKLLAAGTAGGVAHVRPPNGELLIVDPATGQLQRKLKGEGLRGDFRALAFSPDGKTLAAASERIEGLPEKYQQSVKCSSGHGNLAGARRPPWHSSGVTPWHSH